MGLIRAPTSFLPDHPGHLAPPPVLAAHGSLISISLTCVLYSYGSLFPKCLPFVPNSHLKNSYSSFKPQLRCFLVP